MTFPINGKIKNVPNHQPAIVNLGTWEGHPLHLSPVFRTKGRASSEHGIRGAQAPPHVLADRRRMVSGDVSVFRGKGLLGGSSHLVSGL